MEVQAALAEPDHGRIAPAMKARCILDTYPDRVFEGRMEAVGSVVRESGHRGRFASATKSGFPVRISLARTDPLMRPGLSVPVEVVRAAWIDRRRKVRPVRCACHFGASEGSVSCCRLAVHAARNH